MCGNLCFVIHIIINVYRISAKCVKKWNLTDSARRLFPSSQCLAVCTVCLMTRTVMKCRGRCLGSRSFRSVQRLQLVQLSEIGILSAPSAPGKGVFQITGTLLLREREHCVSLAVGLEVIQSDDGCRCLHVSCI
jgi:hypothetical protein